MSDLHAVMFARNASLSARNATAVLELPRDLPSPLTGAIASHGSVPAFLLAILLSLPILFWITRKKYHSSFAKLPSPPAYHFALGNIPLFFGAGQVTKGVGAGHVPFEWFSSLGPTLRVPMAMQKPALITIDKVALTYILRHGDTFPKQKMLRRQLARYLDDGIVSAEGRDHRRQRKLMNGAFAPGSIKAMNDIFLRQGRRITEKLCALYAATQSEGQGLRVDFLKYAMQWSLDTVGEGGFGVDMGGISETPSRLAEAFEASVKNFGKLTPMWVMRGMLPFLDWIPSAEVREVNRNKLATRAASRAVFEQRKQELLRGEVRDRRDVLTNLLRANLDPALPQDERLSDDNIVAQIGTFLLASKSNSGFAASWTVYELARNPRVQSKLREELLNVPTLEPDSDTLAALPYLNAVIREGLRLHSAVPQTMRVAEKDVIIPLAAPAPSDDGGLISEVHLKKGTAIIIPIRYVNQCTSFWGADAAEFRPERFLEEEKSYQDCAGMWGNILAFLDGPRGCIGYRFALAELRGLLFALFRDLKFELVDGVEIDHVIAMKKQPAVAGEVDKGMQLPLMVTALRHE